MARWWRSEHHIAKTPFVDIVVEPRTGGRWFERDKDGAECEWGKVLLWQPPERLVFAWQITAEWQYDPDFVTELEVRRTQGSGEIWRQGRRDSRLIRFAGRLERRPRGILHRVQWSK